MILVDGVVHEGRVAPFDFGDRGFTLGDGLFETMLSLGGVVHRLGDHLDRILAGLDMLGIPIDRGRLASDVATVAAGASQEGAVLRLAVTRGPGMRGLAPPDEPDPLVVVAASAYDPALAMRPVRATISSIRRNDRSPLSQLKSPAYLDNVLALAEARARGAGEAILLNTSDRVACASAGNVFRVVGDRLETPPVVDGVLPGVIRARIMALAPRLGLSVAERSLSEHDLEGADAVFVTNSVRLVQPVTEIDGATLPQVSGDWVPALFALIADEAEAETGQRPWSGT